MKSVKRVFTKSLPRYNLRSRKSAVPVARNSTPKVNREVQASLSEEENCTLSFELPFHPSSLPPTAHVTSSSEEIEPIQSNGLPRFSTAFSEQNPANRTNTEAIDISIDPCEGPSIVQQSLPEPTTSFVPRQESDASPSEDFIPQQSSQSHHGPRTDLEVEETSDSEVDESLERRFFQLINSPADFDALVRKSINYTEPKQTAPQRRFRCESSSSDSTEEEGSEDSAAYSEELSADERSKDNEPQMDRELIETLGKIAQRLGSKDINISKFYGYDREDIDQWLEEFDYQLEARDISPESKAALTQLTIHIAGPAQEYIRTLPADQRATLGLVKDALKRCYSHRNREWVQRQQIAQRRQKPTEPLGDYVSDVVSKLHKLDMQENTRVYHFIEGLKPELQMEVLKAKPKTLSEAVETAREFDALLVRGNKSTPSEHTTEQGLINKLGELVSKLAGNPGASASVERPLNPEHPIVARMESLVTKAENLPYHSGSQESRSILREIREIKQSLLGEIQELDRRVDARINGLARRNQNRREEPPRQRTREGRPICYSCGRVGHVQQNCDQRSPREPNSNFDRYQPNQQRRQPSGDYPPRSGYNQTQRQDRLPSQDPRNRLAAVVDNEYQHGHMAPLVRNRARHVFPQSGSEFSGVAVSENDPQVDDELFRQLQTVFQSLQRVASGVHDEATSKFLPASQTPPSDLHPQYESAYINDGAFKTSAADPSENVSQTGLGTKAKPDVATRPLGASSPYKKKEKMKPKKRQKKHESTEAPLISSPVRCTGAISTAVATVSTNSESKEYESTPDPFVGQPSISAGCVAETEKLVPDLSQPQPSISAGCVAETETLVLDLSQPQPSISAGCEPELVNSVTDPSPAPPSTSAGYETGIANSVQASSLPQLSASTERQKQLLIGDPGHSQIPCAPTQVTADQCNVATEETRPCANTVVAQLRGRDIRLLVDTGAGMSVIDEQFLRDLFDGKLPTLQQSELISLKTVSGEPLPVLGTLRDTLLIAGGKYPCELQVVSNLTYEAVLGRDFLKVNGAVLNLKDGTLQLDDIPEDQFVSNTFCPVRAMSTCVIPPSSESVIPAKLDVEFPPGRFGVIEPSQHLMERYQLQGASVLAKITAHHTIPFRMINPTCRPVTVYKGANLGIFTRLDTNSHISSLDEQPNKKRELQTDTPDVPVDFSTSALTSSQQAQLQNLINEYRDIFALSPQELGRTNWVQHTINTQGASSIRMRPYRVPEAQKERIENCIDEMLEQGIIRPSASPWASPVVLVKKPDGSDRFCVDFRALNDITKKDSYPLPRIAESLDALSGTQYFSSMDLMSGYWQIEMDPESREKTAFVTHAGLFEFNVMPFGLCNAPSCFQRLMECVLRSLNWRIALIYLDDVLVYSRTFSDHLDHLRLVFDRFREAGLKLKPKKCHFGQKSVKFLGHVISKHGVQPDPDKIKAIKEYPVPRKVKDVRAFLGLANYYRKFVKDFAKIAGPLHDLTKKALKFQWTDECQAAFERLKSALIQAPILAYPDFTLPFDLYVDASDEALGMVLGQVQNGREVVISYSGRKLLPAEKNYSVTEREALAVVAGIKYFQPYVYGRRFTVHTDHNAVRWLMNIKEPTGRLARWAVLLQQYDFNIVHRSGKSNGNADALSIRDYDNLIAPLDKGGVQTEKIRDLQRRDPALADIIEYLEFEELPNDSKAAKQFLYTIEQYYLDPEGILCHIWVPEGKRSSTPKSQLVVPASLRHEILVNVHDLPTGGHLGVNKTYAKLRERYFWPKIYMDVQHWCLSCEHCAMKKTPRQRQTSPLLPIPVEAPFEKVSCDISGPWPVTHDNNRYILVFIDMCTKWPEAFAIPNIEAKTVAEIFVKEIVSRHGAPRVLLSDRGSNFLSSLFREVCFLMNTEKIFTSGYRPQTNGLVERFNGTLAQSLSMYVSSDQKDWDQHLNSVLFAY